MINLLPPDRRAHLHYGRLNGRLLRWSEIGVMLVAILIVLISVAWLYIDKQVNNLNHSVASSQAQLKSENLEQVQKQADQISQNVRIINQVLGREIRFSDLIQEIGKVMPPGTVLGSMTLGNINGALDLTANAKDYASAAQVAVNLSDPKNNLFAKVDIVNVNCTPGGSVYNCSATFRALFDKKTQNRFLNFSTGAQ